MGSSLGVTDYRASGNVRVIRVVAASAALCCSTDEGRPHDLAGIGPMCLVACQAAIGSVAISLSGMCPPKPIFNRGEIVFRGRSAFRGVGQARCGIDRHCAFQCLALNPPSFLGVVHANSS